MKNVKLTEREISIIKKAVAGYMQYVESKVEALKHDPDNPDYDFMVEEHVNCVSIYDKMIDAFYK